MSCSVTLQAHIYKIGSHELSMLNIFDFENDLALLCMTIGWLKFTYQRRKDEGMNVQYCVYSVWMWEHVSVWLEIYFLMLLYFILYLWFTFGFIHLRCKIQKKMCFFPTANLKCFFFYCMWNFSTVLQNKNIFHSDSYCHTVTTSYSTHTSYKN